MQQRKSRRTRARGKRASAIHLRSDYPKRCLSARRRVEQQTLACSLRSMRLCKSADSTPDGPADDAEDGDERKHGPKRAQIRMIEIGSHVHETAALEQPNLLRLPRNEIEEQIVDDDEGEHCHRESDERDDTSGHRGIP